MGDVTDADWLRALVTMDPDLAAAARTFVQVASIQELLTAE
ncbi:hypothetical protein [Rhizobium etli]|nr:hypothetical protein [Rhizobium etli]